MQIQTYIILVATGLGLGWISYYLKEKFNPDKRAMEKVLKNPEMLYERLMKNSEFKSSKDNSKVQGTFMEDFVDESGGYGKREIKISLIKGLDGKMQLDIKPIEIQSLKKIKENLEQKKPDKKSKVKK